MSDPIALRGSRQRAVRKTWRDRRHGFTESKRWGLRWLCKKPCGACAYEWRKSVGEPMCDGPGCTFWAEHAGACVTLEGAMAFD